MEGYNLASEISKRMLSEFVIFVQQSLFLDGYESKFLSEKSQSTNLDDDILLVRPLPSSKNRHLRFVRSILYQLTVHETVHEKMDRSVLQRFAKR